MGIVFRSELSTWEDEFHTYNQIYCNFHTHIYNKVANKNIQLNFLHSQILTEECFALFQIN